MRKSPYDTEVLKGMYDHIIGEKLDTSGGQQWFGMGLVADDIFVIPYRSFVYSGHNMSNTYNENRNGSNGSNEHVKSFLKYSFSV